MMPNQPTLARALRVSMALTALSGALAASGGCGDPAADGGPDAQRSAPASQQVGRVGSATDRIGVYSWGTDDTSYPGSPDRLNWTAGQIAALGGHTIRVTIALTDPYRVNPGGAYSLAAVAQSPAYRALFANPAFHTFLLTAYTALDGVNAWHDGFDASEHQAERDEIAALGRYLLATYPDKTFVISNWEGDNAIAPYAGDRAAWDGFVDWINARAAGVRDARGADTGQPTRLFSAMEFNRVRGASDGQGACDDDAHRCVLRYAGPRVTVDYYSYSSYESIGTDTATPDIAARLAADMNTAMGVVGAARSGIGPQHFMLGEFGFAREVPDWGECITARRAAEVVRAALAWGAAYAIYWQVIDNAPAAGDAFPGFGLYKRTGQLTLTGRLFEQFYRAGGPVDAPVPARCPQVNAGGVGDGVTNTTVIHPDSVLSIYGRGFSAAGNTVQIVQAGRRYTATAGPAPWFESEGQINAQMPAGIVPGAGVLVFVTDADGVDSNGQLVTIVPR